MHARVPYKGANGTVIQEGAYKGAGSNRSKGRMGTGTAAHLEGHERIPGCRVTHAVHDGEQLASTAQSVLADTASWHEIAGRGESLKGAVHLLVAAGTEPGWGQEVHVVLVQNLGRLLPDELCREVAQAGRDEALIQCSL